LCPRVVGNDAGTLGTEAIPDFLGKLRKPAVTVGKAIGILHLPLVVTSLIEICLMDDTGMGDLPAITVFHTGLPWSVYHLVASLAAGRANEIDEVRLLHLYGVYQGFAGTAHREDEKGHGFSSRALSFKELTR